VIAPQGKIPEAEEPAKAFFEGEPAMRTIRVVTCCALVIVSTLLMPVSAQVPDLTTIDVPGASSTQPFGINPRRDIVGFYVAGATFHGFVLHEGTLPTIDFPGASSTLAVGVNSRGDIIGQYTAGGITHGYLRDKDGTFTTIDVHGATATEALAINPQGDIVGQYSAGGTNHGFLIR
jgi:uncharacterized membrane protein